MPKMTLSWTRESGQLNIRTDSDVGALEGVGVLLQAAIEGLRMEFQAREMLVGQKKIILPGNGETGEQANP
jgi:hypothetical protein